MGKYEYTQAFIWSSIYVFITFYLPTYIYGQYDPSTQDYDLASYTTYAVGVNFILVQ